MSDFYQETRSLMISVSVIERRFIQLLFDRERHRVLLFKSHRDLRPIALKDIIHIGYGSAAKSSPDDFNLDTSVRPYWFTLTYTVNDASEEVLNILALDPSASVISELRALEPTDACTGRPGVVEALVNVRIHVSDLLSAPIRSFVFTNSDSADHAHVELSTEMQLNAMVEESGLQAFHSRLIADLHSPAMTSAVNDNAASAHASPHYWKEWPFMIVLDESRWDAAAIDRLRAHMGDIVRLEDRMRPLEAREHELWNEYVRNSSKQIPASPLVQDELLKAYSDPGVFFDISPEEKEGRLAVLQQLELLRHQKSWELDHFHRPGIVGRLHIDTSQHPSGLGIAEYYSNIGARFWAILIGINDYADPHVNDLRGCVADVKLVAEYLTAYLHVPESHIIVLTSPRDDKIKGTDGGLPSRANILKMLYDHFRDNTQVCKGDNLFLHFSGHGTSYGVVREFGSDFTEALCPMDRGQQEGDTTVCDISDREINTIFSEICAVKGPNLTVVFDCALSGAAKYLHLPNIITDGGKRGMWAIDNPDAVRRMFEIAERDPRRSSERRLCDESWSGDMTSHVLIVACLGEEMAEEMILPQGGRVGAFTYALVSALKSPYGTDPTLTYADLIQKVIQPPPSQTVVVAGARRNSRLWFQEGPIPGQESSIRSLA